MWPCFQLLNSDRAIQVNIEIMRAFVRLRQMLAAHKDLVHKLAALEKKYDDQFKIVFEVITELMIPAEDSPKKIGFEIKEKKGELWEGGGGGEGMKYGGLASAVERSSTADDKRTAIGRAKVSERSAYQGGWA